MREVFDAFLVPKDEYIQLTLKMDITTAATMKERKKATHKIIDIPLFFKPLSDMPIADRKVYSNFLYDNYRLKTTDYSFYTSNLDVKFDTPDNKALAKALKNRLIIPFFKNGKMIYYQARDITDNSKLKYISANIQKTNILFNIDSLNLYSDAPLYVVEGPFDAINVNGVATLGNELTSAQIELLRASKRRKVLIPDFGGDSQRLMEQFIS